MAEVVGRTIVDVVAAVVVTVPLLPALNQKDQYTFNLDIADATGAEV